MLEFILAILAFGFTYVYYILVMKPKSIIKKYQRLFESHGYKVKVYPFHFLKSAVI